MHLDTQRMGKRGGAGPGLPSPPLEPPVTGRGAGGRMRVAGGVGRPQVSGAAGLARGASGRVVAGKPERGAGSGVELS